MSVESAYVIFEGMVVRQVPFPIPVSNLNILRHAFTAGYSSGIFDTEMLLKNVSPSQVLEIFAMPCMKELAEAVERIADLEGQLAIEKIKNNKGGHGA